MRPLAFSNHLDTIGRLLFVLDIFCITYNLSSAGSCPESSGSSTMTSNFQRLRGSRATTPDENKRPSGVLRPTKTSTLKAQGKVKAAAGKDNPEPRKKEETSWNTGILASVDVNGSFDGSVTSSRSWGSSAELRQGGKSKETTANKKRWL